MFHCVNLFIYHSTVDRHLCCFQLWVIMGNVAVRIPVCVFLLDVHLGGELLGNEVFLVFAAVITQVLKVVVQVYMLSSSVRWLLPPHSL